jgi:hypothetical protein
MLRQYLLKLFLGSYDTSSGEYVDHYMMQSLTGIVLPIVIEILSRCVA